jgi:hypothetical protein
VGSGFRTFTAGEVLTASNVQNYLMDQSVMVFGGSAARSSAIGTANFEEGMVSYLTDTDKVEAYNGTNWVSVAPTTSQGLTLINTTSFSAVSSFSLAADTFTATYDNYLLMVTVNTNSADSQVLLRVRASGTDLTGSDYNYAYSRARSSAQAIVTGGASQTSIFIGEVESTFNGRAAYKVDFISPKVLDRTRVVFQAIDSDAANAYASGAGGGVVNNALAYDSATVFVATGTFGGSYSVYGYNK